MRALILWGEPRSTNLGVRALGQGTAALVERVWPGADVRFQGYGPGDAPDRLGDPRRLVRRVVTRQSPLPEWLRSFDVVVDTRAGDSFADIYGRQRLLSMCAVAELAHRVRVPLVMGPQTVGPFGSRSGRLLARRSLHTARRVLVRDSASARAARELGREPDAATTDVVFALPVPEVARDRDVVLNVSGLLWVPNPHVDAEAYRTTVRTVTRRLLAAGRRITLVPHVLDSPLADNDLPAVTALGGEFGGEDVDVVVPESLTEVREVLASAQLVLGSRMHACLNALSVGVPAVPLAYSRKFAPLLGDLGWDLTVDLRSPGDHAERVLEAVAHPGLHAAVERTRERAAAQLALAEQSLAGLA